MTEKPPAWDVAYEWRAVSLLALGFGLLAMDRWVLPPLFPAIAHDLHLNYRDLGALVGVLSITWGLFAAFAGRLSDRIGRRKVLIPALLLFSAFCGLSGLATSLTALLLIRGLMGVSEGAYLPASVAGVADASHPRRRGFNQGAQMSAFALFGLGIGPILATQLLQVLPSWRWVFAILTVPGLIVALLMIKVLRDPPHLAPAAARPTPVRWGELLRTYNLVLAMLLLLCAMSGVFVISALLPSYLTDYLKLSPPRMGFVISALGIGGFVGEWVLGGLSDLVGRKGAVTGSFVASLVLLWLFARIGADPGLLFVTLFGVAFFCFGLLALLTGPVATEAVPLAAASTAIGLVSGVGEIFGGGAAPAIAGAVAQRYGIQHVLEIALAGLAVGAALSLALRETAPRRSAVSRVAPSTYPPAAQEVP